MVFLVSWPDQGMGYFLAAQRTLAGLGLGIRLCELIDLGVSWYATSQLVIDMPEFAVGIVEEYQNSVGGLKGDQDKDQIVAIIEECCTIVHEYLEMTIPHMFKMFNRRLYVKQVAPGGILLETRNEH